MKRKKGGLFNIWCWENWISTCKRMKLDSNLKLYREINSEWNNDPKVRPETIKILEENIEVNLHNIGFGNDVLNMIPKAHTTKINR